MAEETASNPSPYAPSTSSRKRSRKSVVAVKDEDRISALPDAIILHLFSFLGIKDVVKTSALSRRWSSLWTQTSDVTIDMESFQDFSCIQRFFLLCTSPVIRKLHLLGPDYELGYNFNLKDNVDLWIRFAVGRGVEDLCIDLCNDSRDDDYVLSRALIRCESLKWLKLRSCEFPSLRDGDFMGIRWSSLRELSLDDTKMVDDVINGVLEGSPLLESLTLENCYGMNNIKIFSKNMKELVIHRYFDPYGDEDDDEALNRRRENLRLEIYAPYLRSLRLLDVWEGKEVIVLKEVPSLVEVELNFKLTFDKTKSDIIYGSMRGILNKLRFVDKFVIGNEILMDLHNYKGNGDFSLQLKCRCLTITTLGGRYSLGQIAGVLEIAPNVEKLVIDFTPKTHYTGIPTNAESFFNNEILRGKSWKSWTDFIKNIEITSFPYRGGAEPIYWLSLIKVLLRDALMLEKMVINAKWSWRRHGLCLEEGHAWDVLEVAESILGYQRGSKAAKVILNYPFKRSQSSVRSS